MSDSLEGAGRKADLSELNLFHRNPRVGNIDVIKGSLRAHGQFKPILINKGTHTGRPNEVLAGNHTVKALRDLAEDNPNDERWLKVDVWEIDVDDDRANRIVVADNRTSELGHTDEESLLELLKEMDDLDGTGYEEDDLEDLIALMEENEQRANNASENDLGEGLSLSNSDEDKADTYAERGTRMFILSFPYAQYSWVAEKLEEYADAHEDCGDTNAEIVLHWLAEYSGEEPPQVSAEEADEDDEDFNDVVEEALEGEDEDDL